ncbi:MAG: lipid IV(A) 3-deoxy-D-manno-octulosonic acid transferase [Pseudomonadota bacterium]
MLTLYRVFLYLCLPVFLARLLFKGLQNPKYLDRIRQRMGFLTIKPEAKGIWVHAVSMGEVNAAAPLVQRLLSAKPNASVTITTMTPTGSERVGKLFGDRVSHCYLPYDYPGAARRFLKTVEPDLAIVMETEIWPNFIHACHKKSIPMVYANVRLSRRSHRGYRRFKKLIASTLQKIDLFAVQAKPDAKRLIRLGANPSSVHVTGSIKFDISIPPSVGEAAQAVRRNLGWDRPVWVAGSTHQGEESLILEAFESIRREHRNALLVLVPRHPERFTTVFRLCTRMGFTTALRSESLGDIDSDTQVYLGDTMGELQLLIAASDAAFIGGSLVPVGGHNVLEACAASVPVVFGPHMFNFSEISEMVLQQGAGLQALDPQDLSDVVGRWFDDPLLRTRYGTAGLELVESNKGALDRVESLIEQMNPRPIN